MKKIFSLIALLGLVVTLSACEFIQTEDIETTIENCQADEECKELIDQYIDEALEERGLTETVEEDVDSSTEEVYVAEGIESIFDVYDDFYEEGIIIDYDLSLEELLGRELTEDELAAIELVDALYLEVEDKLVISSLVLEIDENGEYVEFDEVAYLEELLERALTDEEKVALEVVSALWEEAMNNYEWPEVDYEWHHEWHHEWPEGFEFPEIEYFDFEMSIEWITEMLERELTESELAALEMVEGLFLELETKFGDLEIMPLYDDMMLDAEGNYIEDEILILETLLDRELTEEEVSAIEVVSSLVEEALAVFEYYSDFYIDEEWLYDDEHEWHHDWDHEWHHDHEHEWHHEWDYDYNGMEYFDFELSIEWIAELLERELTDSELAALEIVEGLYIELEAKFEAGLEIYPLYDEEMNFDVEVDYLTEAITYLELVLERSLTEEELVALETVSSLVDEALEHFEFYIDEEWVYDYEWDYSTVEWLSEVLDRELTEEEVTAIELVDALYEEVWNTEFDYETFYNDTLIYDENYDYFKEEVLFIETVLGRDLTVDELAALELVEALYEEVYAYEDEWYEEWDYTTEEWLSEVLGRELTEEEVTAIELVDALYEEVWNTEFDYETFYNEDEIYDENYDFYAEEVLFIETVLGRELTVEELAALELVNSLYEESYVVDAYEYSVDELVEEISWMLDRELTVEEIEALYVIDQLYLESLDIGVFDLEIDVTVTTLEEEVVILEEVLQRELTVEEIEAYEVFRAIVLELEELYNY